MPIRDGKTLTARGQIQLKFAKRAAKLVNVFHCLIVSADPGRREMFERAAMESGWKTCLCADVAAALTHVGRSLTQLAVVDLEGQDREVFRPLIERLSASGGMLLIVCGNEGDVNEEVWIRQQGAWLYLPGVVDSSNLSLLCGEARHIAERLWKSSNSESLTSAPLAQRTRVT